ncbi:MAG: cob(I)yrinic acid a,c-diamide adenosyltransferase [Candidatus Lokiarchaeota archaeon]|nr:cob(I)yrinic acid a,c-diamide adenosyltransferase [Candidatus Lokiarchaeota archaeon]
MPERQRLSKGIVQVYFGSGKGKTTASLGQAFRAAGHGFKIYMIQWMKGNIKYGELKSAKKFDNFTIEQFGSPELIASPDDFDMDEGRKALERAENIILSDKYDIVILDEAGVAADMGIIDVDDLIAILDQKPEKVEVILTGRMMHPKLKEYADLVTEMRMIKHPYVSKGLEARFGIEH